VGTDGEQQDVDPRHEDWQQFEENAWCAELAADLPGGRLSSVEQQSRGRSVSSPGDGSDNGLLRGYSSAGQKVLTTLPSAAKDEVFVAAEQFRNEIDGFLSFARRQLRERPRNLVRRAHEATSSPDANQECLAGSSHPSIVPG
jgi:hypothetical protein